MSRRADQGPQGPREPRPVATAPSAALTYLDRAAGSLREALEAQEPGDRFAAAHVCALQATAGLLAARARPDTSARGRRQRNAWVLLARVAPELTEWATLFAAGAPKRAAAQSGARHAVTEREADDLLRDADRFLAVVEDALGVVRHTPCEQWSVA